MKNLNISVDPILQEEMVSAILSDRDYASKFMELVDYTDTKRPIKIFTNPNLDEITRLFSQLFEKNDGVFPTKGEMCDEILKLKRNDADKNLIRGLYLKLRERKVTPSAVHERKVVEIVKVANIVGFLNKSIQVMRGVGSAEELLKFESELTKFQAKLESVNFVREDVVDMTDFGEIIYKYASEASNNVDIGLSKLTKELNGGGDNGGLARQEVTVLLSGTNDGKSIAAISFIANALRAGHSVCMFSLEGRRLQAPMRFISNITKIKYKRLVRFRDFVNKNSNGHLAGYFTEEEIKAIKEAQELWGDKVHIIHAIKNCEIEHIENKAIDLYKKHKFDLLVIDYGQLMESVREFTREDLMMQYAFRRIEKLSANLNVASLIPMQVNRSGLNSIQSDQDDGEMYPTYKMGQVAGGYATLKTAGCIITLNRTVEERNEGKARYCITKQREGLVGVQLGLKCNFDVMDMTTGEEYYHFNPGEVTQVKKAPSLMDSFNENNNEVKIDVIVEKNDLLKVLQGELRQEEKDFQRNLQKVMGYISQKTASEQEKKDLMLGNTEHDDPDAEISRIEEFLSEVQSNIYDVYESEEFITQRSELIGENNLKDYSNVLNIFADNIDDFKKLYPDLSYRVRSIYLLKKIEDNS